MADFVLVHGAYHGSWCWSKVRKVLSCRGHRVTTPDLSGMGHEPTPHADVTFECWIDDVLQAMEACNEPVVLVGHSLAGYVVSAVAEHCPNRLSSTVHLSSLPAVSGKSVLEAIEPFRSRQANLRNAPRETTADGSAERFVSAADAADLFYNCCSPEDIAFASSRLGWLPLAPLSMPVHLSPERHGRVRRAFVECRQDRALELDIQRRFQQLHGFDQLLSLDSDHSPFLCQAEALGDALEAVASAS